MSYSTMMLLANTCLVELVLGSDILSMIIFKLQNDLKQIQYEDSLCVFRGYMGFVFCALQNYSFLLQAVLSIYNYVL